MPAGHRGIPRPFPPPSSGESQTSPGDRHLRTHRRDGAFRVRRQVGGTHIPSRPRTRPDHPRSPSPPPSEIAQSSAPPFRGPLRHEEPSAKPFRGRPIASEPSSSAPSEALRDDPDGRHGPRQGSPKAHARPRWLFPPPLEAANALETPSCRPFRDRSFVEKGLTDAPFHRRRCLEGGRRGLF